MLENRTVIPELYPWDEYRYYLEGEDKMFYEYIPDNECVCIRALIDHKKTKRKVGNHEHIIRSFDDTGFYLFRKFIKKHLFHRDAVYNLFYNIYKVDCVKGQCFSHSTGYKMIGRIENVTSTNLLAIDLDAYSFEEYKEVRKLFLDRDIIPIEVSSGHGFHLLVRIETCTDRGLLSKWLQVMSDYNINVDQHCKDPGRVYRLPFFYNIKSAKYDTVAKAEIMDGEYGVPVYKVSDVFQRFGMIMQIGTKICLVRYLQTRVMIHQARKKPQNLLKKKTNQEVICRFVRKRLIFQRRDNAIFFPHNGIQEMLASCPISIARMK